MTHATADVAQTPRRWYHRNWLIVALLVGLPIVGVPLTWTARWSLWGRATGTVLGSLWLLTLIQVTAAETARLSCPGMGCDVVALSE